MPSSSSFITIAANADLLSDAAVITESTVSGARSTAGYGSPTLLNTGCNVEGSTLCQAQTKELRQVTGGIWQDLFKGSYGRVAVGVQGSYTVRQAFSGVDGSPKTNVGVALGSFRYYPF